KATLFYQRSGRNGAGEVGYTGVEGENRDGAWPGLLGPSPFAGRACYSGQGETSVIAGGALRAFRGGPGKQQVRPARTGRQRRAGTGDKPNGRHRGPPPTPCTAAAPRSPLRAAIRAGDVAVWRNVTARHEPGAPLRGISER